MENFSIAEQSRDIVVDDSSDSEQEREMPPPTQGRDVEPEQAIEARQSSLRFDRSIDKTRSGKVSKKKGRTTKSSKQGRRQNSVSSAGRIKEEVEAVEEVFDFQNVDGLKERKSETWTFKKANGVKKKESKLETSDDEDETAQVDKSDNWSLQGWMDSDTEEDVDNEQEKFRPKFVVRQEYEVPSTSASHRPQPQYPSMWYTPTPPSTPTQCFTTGLQAMPNMMTPTMSTTAMPAVLGGCYYEIPIMPQMYPFPYPAPGMYSGFGSVGNVGMPSGFGSMGMSVRSPVSGWGHHSGLGYYVMPGNACSLGFALANEAYWRNIVAAKVAGQGPMIEQPLASRELYTSPMQSSTFAQRKENGSNLGHVQSRSDAANYGPMTRTQKQRFQRKRKFQRMSPAQRIAYRSNRQMKKRNMDQNVCNYFKTQDKN